MQKITITRSLNILAGTVAGLIALVAIPTFAFADTTPPSVPTGLTGTAQSTSQVYLSWSPSSDDTGVTGYQIFRGGTEIGAVSGTSYTDSSLNANTTYSYTVDAYDGYGNVSAQSSAVSVTTPTSSSDTTAPSIPTNLVATPASATQINLSWNASSDNVGVSGYRVYRNGTQIGTTASANYSDTGLSPATSYYYTVSAYDAAGNNSSQSGSVTTSTYSSSSADTSAPSIPTGLVVSPVSSSQINLSWNASSDNVGVTQYVIYRNGTQIATISGTSYSDTGLSASTGYYYTVAALDAAGNNSGQSGSVSGTTYSSSSSDTSVPTVPTGLSASPVSSSQINLTWYASSDNVGVSGYRIYRNGTQIASTGSTSYSDTGLAASTGYTYTVAAYDAAGNTSSQSSSISATTLATGSTVTTSSYTVPPTVEIGPDGTILLHGFTVTSVGTNTFTGTVWGITYTVTYSGSVNTGNGFQFLLRGGDSSTINSSQIQVGDVLGVQGTVSQSQPLAIQAQTVRDYSITAARAGNTTNSGYGTAYTNGDMNNIPYLENLLEQLRNQFNTLRGFRGR